MIDTDCDADNTRDISTSSECYFPTRISDVDISTFSECYFPTRISDVSYPDSVNEFTLLPKDVPLALINC